MTVQIGNTTINVPSSVASSYEKLSASERKMAIDNFFETIIDLDDLKTAEAHNRDNPATYTIEDIRKELDLA